MDNNDFNNLRTLLAWKRHETPPPGFFQHFPDRIISRIESEQVLCRQSWLTRLMAFVDFKPLVACSYGLALGGLLVWGINSTPADTGDNVPTFAGQPHGSWPSAALALIAPTQAPGSEPQTTDQTGVILANAPGSPNEITSAQPVFDSPPAFLMNRSRTLISQQVRFTR